MCVCDDDGQAGQCTTGRCMRMVLDPDLSAHVLKVDSIKSNHLRVFAYFERAGDICILTENTGQLPNGSGILKNSALMKLERPLQPLTSGGSCYIR